MTWEIKTCDVLDGLRGLPDGSVHCCVTSPPYFALRDYGVDGQIGLESTPEAYVAKMVEVFGEVRRVLRDDGVCFINIGDSYWGSWGNAGSRPELDGKTQNQRPKDAEYFNRGGWDERRDRPASSYKHSAIKPKDLIGIPWMLAFALRADGWYLRSEIIWHKKSPMPESVQDRPTKAHEQVFLFSKSQRYFYDAVASAEKSRSAGRIPMGNHKVDASRNDAGRDMTIPVAATRNMRSVFKADEPLCALRDDLTEGQRRYVISELISRGLL